MFFMGKSLSNGLMLRAEAYLIQAFLFLLPLKSSKKSRVLRNNFTIFAQRINNRNKAPFFVYLC
jgi:hypothetical protein